MKREDVYKLIDGEREYQELAPARDYVSDQSHSIGDWLLYVEQHIELAKAYVYEFSFNEALEEVRKMAALCVACMEYNETKPRSL